MTNKTKDNKNIRKPGRKAYYKLIKDRLSEYERTLAAQGYQLIYSQLAANMCTQYNIETSDQKIRAMFSASGSSDREIPLAEMVALCHMLHIPIYDICGFPEAPSAEIDPPWLKRINPNDNSGINQLYDEFYLGKYYCYYFSRDYLDNTQLAGKSQAEMANIRAAELTIEHEDCVTTAYYREQFEDSDFYKKTALEQLELKGRVYLLERPKQIYTLLMDSQGKLLFSLLFDYRIYSKDILYYRTAAMTTFSEYPHPQQPLFQKMALFRVKQDLTNPETEKMIRGILTLNSNNILVEKSKFNQMILDNPELSKLNHTLENYYSFNETDILNQKLPWSYNEKINAILQLRQVSTSPAQEIISDDKNFSQYTKAVQQNSF